MLLQRFLLNELLLFVKDFFIQRVGICPVNLCLLTIKKNAINKSLVLYKAVVFTGWTGSPWPRVKETYFKVNRGVIRFFTVNRKKYILILFFNFNEYNSRLMLNSALVIYFNFSFIRPFWYPFDYFGLLWLYFTKEDNYYSLFLLYIYECLYSEFEQYIRHIVKIKFKFN